MPSFAVASSIAATGAAAGYCTVNTTAARRALIREIGTFCQAATASQVGLGTPASSRGA